MEPFPTISLDDFMKKYLSPKEIEEIEIEEKESIYTIWESPDARGTILYGPNKDKN